MKKASTKTKKAEKSPVIRLGKRGNIDPRELRKAVVAVKKQWEEEHESNNGQTKK